MNVNSNVNEKTSNRESIGNTESCRNPKNWDTENRDTNFCDTDFRYANKENNNKDNNKKQNNVVVDIEKETKLINLYKSFKIEKRFMPHTKKMLLEYVDKFDLNVFEKVFIAASEESVIKKYAYMKKVFETLDRKNIKTLDDYLKDQENFKNKKETKVKQEKNSNSVNTKYHNTFNEHYKNYTVDELDSKLRSSKPNNDIEKQLYLTALENGLGSLSQLSQNRVVNYALEHHLEVPK